LPSIIILGSFLINIGIFEDILSLKCARGVSRSFSRRGFDGKIYGGILGFFSLKN